MQKQDKLPKELTQLVHWSVSLLGEIIREQTDNKTFSIIENLRKKTKLTHKASPQKVHTVIEDMYTEIQKHPSHTQHHICHAFGMMLELINVCEVAYRSYRLKSYPSLNLPSKCMDRITWVLTAHPTEARRMELIEFFDRIQETLVQSLVEGRQQNEQKLKFWMTLAWKIPLAKHKKPGVIDEAEAIASIVLKEKIIDQWISLYQAGIPVHLRTWVGGDKDGHPGVDEKAMIASLNTSRKYIVTYLKHRCDKSLEALFHLERGYVTLTMASEIRSLKASLTKLHRLNSNDGARCKNLFNTLERVLSVYKQELGVECFYLKQMHTLLTISPALVIPLELREDSSVVAEALSSPKSFAIGRMLLSLQKLSGSFPTGWYAKGFILSMTESTKDLINGVELLKKTIPSMDLPVVPLFENEKALLLGAKILEDFAHSKSIRNLIRSQWENCIEVMVGYSDSSKENGALRSRQLIESALFQLDQCIRNLGFEPRFFHGSGGSVARGGGSIEDQTSWWPKTAQQRFKATIQGEMIARSFASPEVFTRQASKIMQQTTLQPVTVEKSLQKAVEQLALSTRDQYRLMVSDEYFMNIVAKSTPYSYLQLLKIGSRPSKRKQELSLNNLRAIPWILCWTQTRILFPSWWGLGTAWHLSSAKQKKVLTSAFKKSPVFKSYIHLMGFTLAKIELGVWKSYLAHSELSETEQKKIFKKVLNEYQLTKSCIQQITGKKDLLWYKPWLGVSISLRSPLIHPLNALQLIALKNNDNTLLRETVTGIASGMMTTG